MSEQKQNRKILVVDDEKNMRRVLAAMLNREGYISMEAENGQKALELFDKDQPACIITDLKMPDVDGLELLQRVKEKGPHVPVIMITAHGTVDTAVSAMKKGAFDYLTKPFDKAELLNVVGKAVNSLSKNLQEPSLDISEDAFITGNDPAMDETMKLVDRVSQTDITVLITGETGTGKELIARAIHLKCSRRDHPFVAINCAAIPDDLTESELFGYEKGAFTGAVLSKPGRFELGHKGTLFLDEIGTLSQKVQGKLLRVLQEQSFERVGGIKTIKVDTRLIAATNSNLKALVDGGDFREDLYYRLNVIEIPIPALRDRPYDIIPLCNYFISKFAAKQNKEVFGVDPEVKSALLTYSWPGNIRELENAMERAVLMADEEIIAQNDLPPQILSVPVNVEGKTTQGTLKEVVKGATSRLEKQIIMEALEKTGHNVTRTAKLLGLSRKGLQIKMKALGLRDQDDS